MPRLVMLPAPRIMSAPGVVWLKTPPGLTCVRPLLTYSVAFTVPMTVIRPLDVFDTRPNAEVAREATVIAPPLVKFDSRSAPRSNSDADGDVVLPVNAVLPPAVVENAPGPASV